MCVCGVGAARITFSRVEVPAVIKVGSVEGFGCGGAPESTDSSQVRLMARSILEHWELILLLA